MNRQFDPRPLVCPHCGHVLGQQAYFQSFEYKVADWIGAEVAPPATKGFDVWHSKHFPDLTFQVKYAHDQRGKHSRGNTTFAVWRWVVKSLDDRHPDFFVLFGVRDDEEHCFLLSRADFLADSYIAGDKRRIMHASAKERSDRKNYNYIPRIWRYKVSNPEQTLIERVRHYAPRSDDELFYERHSAQARHIVELRDLGYPVSVILKECQIGILAYRRLVKTILPSSHPRGWTNTYPVCRDCGTDERKHTAYGYCRSCYMLRGYQAE